MSTETPDKRPDEPKFADTVDEHDPHKAEKLANAGRDEPLDEASE